MNSIRKKDILMIAVLIFFFMISVTLINGSVYASSKKGTISSLSNVSSGIKISWTKDTSKSGYRIYRKAGNETKWSMIKEITSSSKTSWIDKDTKNGTKYTYKVRSFKKKKLSSNSKTSVIYRLETPAIESLTASGIRQITLKSSRNSKATGYEIKYAPSSKFKGSKERLPKRASPD